MKKIISVFLAAAMLFSFIPFVSAEDGGTTPGNGETHTHTPEPVEAKEATCAEEGYIAHYKCSVCNKLFTDETCETELTAEEIATAKSTVHTPEPVEAKEATCAEEGYVAHYKCSVCNKLFTDETCETELTAEEIATPKSTVHTPEPVEAKEATCAEEGYIAHYKCAVCNKIFSDETCETELTAEEIRTAKTTVHNTEKVEARPATCTKPGSIAYYACTVCGKLFYDAAGAAEIADPKTVEVMGAHTPEAVEAKEATCAEEGSIAHIRCAICKKIFADEACTVEYKPEDILTPKTNAHKTEKIEAKTATCAAAGNIAYYACTVCGRLFYDAAATAEIADAADVTVKAAHTPEKVAAKEATCTQAGSIEYYVCTVCKQTFADEACARALTAEETQTPKAAHKTEKTAAKAATCTSTGNIAYFTCTVCGGLFADAAGTKPVTAAETVTEKAAHRPIFVKVDRNTHLQVCAVCATKLQPTPVPHEWKDDVCAACGLEKVYKPGDADGNEKLEAADARLALRGAVGLDEIKPGSSKFRAMDADGNEKLEAADARLILRAAVGYNDPEFKR